jgi:hypothetical protein
MLYLYRVLEVGETKEWEGTRRGKNVRHLIECSSTHTCNAARSGVVHTPSHGRTNFGSEAPRLSPTLFPSHLRRSCVSGYLFCSVGCIPLPLVVRAFLLYLVFGFPVKYIGVSVSSVRTISY